MIGYKIKKILDKCGAFGAILRTYCKEELHVIWRNTCNRLSITFILKGSFADALSVHLFQVDKYKHHLADDLH